MINIIKNNIQGCIFRCSFRRKPGQNKEKADKYLEETPKEDLKSKELYSIF